MLHLLNAIADQHDWRLATLAGLLCAFACWTAVSLLWRARLNSGRSHYFWIAAASGIFGAGLWATHFVALLSSHGTLVVGYGVFDTVTSIAFAIVVSAVGFVLIMRGVALLGGAIAGLAVGGMYYISVEALSGPFDLDWNSTFIVASVITVIVCDSLAALAATRIRNINGRMLAAAFFTVGFAGLHIVGLGAVSLVSDSLHHSSRSLFAPAPLAIAVTAVALLVVLLGLVGALFDNHLFQRRSAEEKRLREYVKALEASQARLEKTMDELRTALAAASAASSAKSAFLAAMSHELRTPLNAIIGFSDLLLTSQMMPASPRQKEYLTDIRRSGSSLLDLINNILDLTRSDIGQIELHEETLDLRSLIFESVASVAQPAETGRIKIHCDLPPSLPQIRGDATLLGRALANLLSNAVKFTPPGGEVSVSSTSDEAGIRIVISDTGIGMAPQEIPLAFERFRQVDGRLARRYEGSGLGLPLANVFVTLHRGSLALESAVGKGTSATVRLPAERIIRTAEAA